MSWFSLLCVLVPFSVTFLSPDRKNGPREPQTTSLHRCIKRKLLPFSLISTCQVLGEALALFKSCVHPWTNHCSFGNRPAQVTHPYLVGDDGEPGLAPLRGHGERDSRDSPKRGMLRKTQKGMPRRATDIHYNPPPAQPHLARHFDWRICYLFTF